MKRGNDWTTCIEKHNIELSAHSIPPLPHTALISQSEWSYSKHTTNQRIQWLRQSTLSSTKVELDQTLFTWFQKLPTQLNTPNRFVPKLVRVSPNSSDGQWLDQCVYGWVPGGSPLSARLPACLIAYKICFWIKTSKNTLLLVVLGVRGVSFSCCTRVSSRPWL